VPEHSMTVDLTVRIHLNPADIHAYAESGTTPEQLRAQIVQAATDDIVEGRLAAYADIYVKETQ